VSRDRSELGAGTSPATQRDLDELAFRRAAALGRPVLVVGFASSGRTRVLDLELPDGAPLAEGAFVEVADVDVHPSPPLDSG
jgi:hypothetical protein